MAQKPRRIGVLTGGGDCPGLNAVLRAVVKNAVYKHGIEVHGIEDGFLGLVEDRVRPLGEASASGILNRGGTILGTSNRCNPQRYAEGYNANGDPVFKDVTDRCLETIRRRGLEALVCVGGDGTMGGASHFIEHGVPCVGVPKTIDNDLHGTDTTFGFSTAVEVATDALDRLHTTASSHHRVMVVEVMGRNAGWIALHAGAASGADVILIPELPYSLKHIQEHIQRRGRRGKHSSIVCIAEGAAAQGAQQVVARLDPTSPDPIRLGGVGAQLADDIERTTGVETRSVNLGHIVRGGVPVAADRVLASRFGHAALELVAAGDFGKLVTVRDSQMQSVRITEIANRQRLVSPEDATVAACQDLGVSFGVPGCMLPDAIAPAEPGAAATPGPGPEEAAAKAEAEAEALLRSAA